MSKAQLDLLKERLDALPEAASTADLSADERIRRAKRAFARGLDDRMAVDLETCIHCGMCAEACHFYIATEDAKYTPAHKFTPLRRYYRRELSPMRWFFRPFTKELRADEFEEWAELCYDSCTGCGRCDMMCPMGINISTLINVMRQGIAAADAEPPEIRALKEEQESTGHVLGVDSDSFLEATRKLAEDGVEVPVDRDTADVMVLTSAIELTAFPEALKAYAKIFNRAGVDWTFSSKAFEAANWGLISGDEAAEKKAVARIVDAAKDCGAKTVVTPELGHGYQALRWDGANRIGAELPFEVRSMAEFVAGQIEAGTLKVRAANGESVVYHDPCRLQRHGGVEKEPRVVLDALGYEVRQTASHTRENLCCGGGCGEYAIRRSADLRHKAFKVKQRDIDETGADKVVVNCAHCRINLETGAERAGWKTPVASLTETVAARIADE